MADIVVTVNSVSCRWTIIVVAKATAPADDQPIREHQGPEGVEAVLRLAGGHKQASEFGEMRKPQTPQVVARPDGSLAYSGVAAFHFLPNGKTYSLGLKVAGVETQLPLCNEVRTEAVGRGLPSKLQYMLPEAMWQTYVGKEHDLGEWLAEAPEDMLWAWQPDYELMRPLWLNACFTLPDSSSPITQCPNPGSRYCLDLTKTGHWLRGKKVRRHKADFCLTVNADYKATFRRCAELHRDQGKGTWITPPLIDALDRCRREGGELKVYSIELWDKSSGKLAAAIMSLSVGDIFHDYTTATMERDSRSPGAILAKVVGHLLLECGYTLWYWGFKNPYMAEYDGNYGGVLLDSRSVFWPRWKAAQQMASACCTAEPSVRYDLAARVPPGQTLDLATL